MSKAVMQLTVNGTHHEFLAEQRKLLSDALREDLQLTGTHVGCEHGVCGACTVLVDGRPMRSCLLFAVQMQRHALTTIEAVARDGVLSGLQQALHEAHGLQCGFCTPGIVMTFEAWLRENTEPTESEVREALSGNLCRCTGYHNIVRAVLDAAVRMRTQHAAAGAQHAAAEAQPAVGEAQPAVGEAQPAVGEAQPAVVGAQPAVARAHAS